MAYYAIVTDTSPDDSYWVKSGIPYEIITWWGAMMDDGLKNGFTVRDGDGLIHYCLRSDCAHLNGRKWSVIDE